MDRIADATTRVPTPAMTRPLPDYSAATWRSR